MNRLALSVIAALALLPAAAEAQTVKPQNGLIAFSGKRGDARVIYTRQKDGTRLRRPKLPADVEHPAFSPRGLRLAFTRTLPTGNQVWSSYLDGTGLRPVTAGPVDGEAQWSPDGSRLVFARGSRGSRDIWSVFADGSGLRHLSKRATDDSSPAWSLRNQIAFVRANRRGDDVYVISSGGGRARRLTRDRADEQYPAWSPTGKTLVFARGRVGRRDLYVTTANGAHTRRLTRVKGDEAEPAFSPDGTRVTFRYTRKGKRRIYLMKVKGKAIKRLPAKSRRVRRITRSSGSAPRFPNWQSTGLDPVVAAAGDIACRPTSPDFNGGSGRVGVCRQLLTSNLLFRMDLTAILTLGDTQYEHGTLADFQGSFDKSWGRLKPLIRPAVGNHEYEGGEPATGYFDYFNGVGRFGGPAGDRDKGWYSYDLGAWHVVTLNSECEHVGGCGSDSPQVQFLRSDLAAHPNRCTLVTWHRPRFTSGVNDDGATDVLPLWEAAYAGGADLLLDGHEHHYERFAPQRPDGTPDPVNGIRQITAGMGGRSHHGFDHIAANSEVRNSEALGVLQLTLHDASYDWKLVRAVSGGTVDSGSATCH